MSLKTDYKDEILRDGEDRRYNLVDENGRVVYSNIKLDKAYTPQQEGDEFNAKDVNNITKSVNQLADSVNQLADPNLLIDGDFQINQDGKNKYVVTDGNWSYTLTMWYFRGVSNSKVVLNNDGTITINNPSNENGVYFVQKLENFDENDYCGSIKVVSVKGVVNFYIEDTTLNSGQQVQLVKGINKFRCNGKPKQFVFQLNAGASITIEYATLYEGNIVHKHMKEDYNIALLKSQRYYEYLETTVYSIGTYYISGFPFRTYKRIVPTVTMRIANDMGYLDGTAEAVFPTVQGVQFILYNKGSAGSLGSQSLVIKAKIDARIY